MLLLRVKPTVRRRPRRRSVLPAVGEPVYRIMGGTDGRGWFGNDALGGRISAPVVTTFSPVIPAGYGIVVFQSLYNYTPSDASLLALAGSGNTLTLTPGAQRAHNAAGSNDGSVTFYHAVLASDCSSCTYDASSLPAGDDGRYGHLVFYIVQRPDTVNGFFTGTPVTNTQTSTTSVNPGTITLPTTDCLELFGWTNRGHTEDLLPLSISPAVFPTDLQHTKLHVVTNSPTDFGSVHNSITQSGSVIGYRNRSGGTHTPSVTFTGSSPTTAAAHSVLVAYNILGGAGDTVLTPSPNSVTVTAQSATVAATVTCAAGVNAVTLTAATATASPGASTLAAGTSSVTLTAPSATISVGANFLDAGIAAVTWTAPTATVAPGISTRTAGTNIITFTAPPASSDVPSPGLGSISADGAENYIGGSATISALDGSVDMGTLGGSISGSVIGGSVS